MVNGNDNPANAAEQARQEQDGAADSGQGRGKPESQLRAAARGKGLTLRELADLMGVSYGYVSQVSSGSRPWSPMLRERAQAVLGEVPGQGVVYRQGGLVQGESTCIRERAREVGLSMGALADLVGVSRSYMSQASRGKRNFSPGVQARVEAVLELRPGWKRRNAQPWTPGPCGTAWMRMVTPRTRWPGWRASAPATCP